MTEFYRVLIADDEYLILQGLKLLLDWEAYHCRIVGEAQDGQQCLELIGRLKPDIVITDIRMPKLSGIDMIRAAQSVHRAKYIILSGYSDFEYARQCMSLGVQEYLLKPVDERMLGEAILRLERQLEQISQNRSRLHTMIEKNERNEMRLRDLFLRDLVNTYFEGAEDIRSALAVEGLALPEGQTYSCLAVDTRRLGVCLNLRGAIREALFGPSILFLYEEGRYMAILSWGEALEQNVYAEKLREIAGRLENRLGTEIVLGAGNQVGLHQLYLSARQALMGGGFPAKPDALAREGEAIGSTRAHMTQIPQPLITSLYAGLSALCVHDVQNSLRKIWEYLRQMGDASLSGTKIYGLSIMLTCVRWMEPLNPGQSAVSDPTQHYYDQIGALEAPGEVERYAENTICELIRAKRDGTPGKVSELVIRVKEYVRDHVYDDTSLVRAARALYVSPVYLSRVFKREAGVSYIDYVTHVKMEAARQLMQTTDLRIYEIANKLGYKDSKYFSQVFRNKWGKNPSDVRK